VFKYLKAMDLLIVASRVESFGRTAVEAMAAGTPVLALKAGGLPEIISHKQNGYLMDSADPDTIQSAVESVFKDPALTSDIVKNGLQTYKERFSLEKHVRQVEDIFAMCLRGKRDHA
ncbi:MAG: glycosyltransferase family 4 protein, partial [Candidatus Aminicenantes bacterium]|nr:glycosyltransferase family 4 protein [Candidatus Aminicenantes bacterium]